MRKFTAISVSCMLLSLLTAAQLIAIPLHMDDMCFNKDWLFQKGEVLDAQNPQLKDENWEAVTLPHDWAIEGEFSD